jgi:excinuclease ABC subunit B
MGSARNRPVPARDYAARAPQVDPRAKAGAFGEEIKGPHKPTLDEMGPHAERGLPSADRPVPKKPTASPAAAEASSRGSRRFDLGEAGEKKKHRHGRPRKTGRPGA